MCRVRRHFKKCSCSKSIEKYRLQIRQETQFINMQENEDNRFEMSGSILNHIKIELMNVHVSNKAGVLMLKYV